MSGTPGDHGDARGLGGPVRSVRVAEELKPGDSISITVEEHGDGAMRTALLNAQARGPTHGSFKMNGAIASKLRAIWRNCPGWEYLSDAQKLAMDEIAIKQARILSATTPDGAKFREHWDDIGGYAKLGGDEC